MKTKVMTMRAIEPQERAGVAAPAQMQDGHDLMQSLLVKDGVAREFDNAPVETPRTIFGVVIGQIKAILSDGRLQLYIAALDGLECIARIACAPQGLTPGADVAVMFEQGDLAHPMVIGPMYGGAASQPASSTDMENAPPEHERIVIEAGQELELRCGEATIVLTADGRILQRGTYISSNASATQRILGGSVQIN